MNKDIEEYTTPAGKKRYRFNIYVGKDEKTGASIQIRKRGYKTRKEAEQAYLNYQVKISNGEYDPNSNSNVKFSKFIEDWLKVYQPTVKESTYATTLRIIDNHIKKDLGNYRLNKLTVAICQNTVNEWAKTSPKVFGRYARYTAKILDYAIKLELITSNPMKKVILPKVKREAKEFTNFYTKKELNDFLFWAKDYSFRAYVFFKLLAYSGLRKGEALALTWNEIDFKEGTLRVEKTLTTGLANTVIVSTPKTRSSIRTIWLEEPILHDLLQWKKVQRQNLFFIDENVYNREQLVFATSNNKHLQLVEPSQWNDAITKKHHLRRITVHGFRHTHASLLFEAGVSMQDVKERLGHSSIKTTMDIYTHVTNARKKETSIKFSSYMEA